MSDLVSRATWRVTALAAPAWQTACSSCRAPNSRFTATDRFRVNANGAQLDVWLLYACDDCGATRKRSLLRRAPVASIAPERLDAYHRNDPACARAHALEIPTREALPYHVERPPLPATGVLLATIEQPDRCGVRWDRFLARELGVSRAAIQHRWRRGAIAIDGAASLSDPVGDRQRLRVAFGAESTGEATVRR